MLSQKFGEDAERNNLVLVRGEFRNDLKAQRKIFYPPFFQTKVSKGTDITEQVWSADDLHFYQNLPKGWNCMIHYDDKKDFEKYGTLDREIVLGKDHKFHGERMYKWVASDGYAVYSKP